ncbi:hypothetical protein GCM10011609_22530 [Lentzea pudingi]|uniref:Uncharacterized protein n=1 Tax=Lentzea pudingi TaxID=1789439 RepID=A0ABQ2HM58_9PSEU|nr:hypothetical protein [Lentzea pudingi]GGM85808.1 hypothetical protein GCM10011609_22530 [Lentzea pudingi]
MTTSLTEVHLAKRLPLMGREILVLGSILSALALPALLFFPGTSWQGVLLWELFPLTVLILCAAWRPSLEAKNAQTLFHTGSGTSALVVEIKACDDDFYEMTLSMEVGRERVVVTHRCGNPCVEAARQRSRQLYVLTHAERRMWGVVHSRSALF